MAKLSLLLKARDSDEADFGRFAAALDRRVAQPGRQRHEMTSKERMKIAMSGGVPDRVPVMPQICHPHAIRMLGLPFRETLLDTLRHPALANQLVLKCAREYGVDGIRAFMAAEPADVEEEGEDAYALDGNGRRIGRVDFQGGGHAVPLEEACHIPDDAALERIEVPSADALRASPGMASFREIIREVGDDLFVASSPAFFTVEYVAQQRGKQQAMCDLIESPDFVHRIIRKATEIAIQKSHALCEAGVDALYLGEVFGGVIGPRLFEEFCVPYIAELVEAVRPHGVLTYLHICGNSTRILELMADTGVDCIEPLDPLGGVEVADAKRRVGDRVALMGGVNTVALAQGGLAEVQAECERCLNEGAPGGGYILACGDMLPTETPPDRVRAMVAAAAQLGSY